MKVHSRVLTTMIALFLLAAMPSLSFGYQNEPLDGFRNIPWATNIRDLGKSMKLDSDEGDDKFYTQKNDQMEIAGTAVDKIIYGFYKDLFYSVIIRFSSEESYVRLKQRLADVYGGTYAYRPRPGVEDYYWGLMDSVFVFRRRSEVVINLVFDSQAKKGHIAYVFTPLSDIIPKDSAPPKPDNIPAEEVKPETADTETKGDTKVDNENTKPENSGETKSDIKAEDGEPGELPKAPVP